MRLLWVFVLVGVAGGVAGEEEGGQLKMAENYKSPCGSQTEEERRTAQEKWEACEGEEEAEFCRSGFLFTATALNKVRNGGELEVAVSLEKSIHPNVTFDVSLRIGGDTDDGAEEEVLAREEVTLEVNELRWVVLQVGDLPWEKAYLVVTAPSAGKLMCARKIHSEITKVASDVEAFVQTDKSRYAPGDTVDYRVLVVDGNVDKTPKFAQIFLAEGKEGVKKWVEVPENGIVRGNFAFKGRTEMRVRVTANATSSDSPLATARTLPVYERYDQVSRHSPWMSVRLDGLRHVFFSQPRVKGRVTLTSTEGVPLEGICNVTITPGFLARKHLSFANEMAERSVAVGLAGGKFEFDVVEELGAKWEEVRVASDFQVDAKCRDLQLGIVADSTETLSLWRSLFAVDLLSVETLPNGNSSHPQATVVLKFLVERRDGGSVEEEEPREGLQVRLLLSKKNLGRLRPSATEFSLPIPPNGRVRLEFEVNDTPPSDWRDRVWMQVGDADEIKTLKGSSVDLSPDIHVTPVDPAWLVRRGDVLRFRVRSCVPYDSVNAILSSQKAIYASHRFSFSPEREELDEVIELTIPQNATEGTFNLLVYGLSTSPHNMFLQGARQSIRVNVVSSRKQQYIKIVDHVDVDMSTIVTFQLEGMPADSVVSLQAAKLESPGGYLDRREDSERPLNCFSWGYSYNWETAGMKNRDDSPFLVKPDDVVFTANFDVIKEIDLSFGRHPQLVFLDVDKETLIGDTGTLIVTKSFNRLKEFGTYVVSGAAFNSKSGRTVFSNSPGFRILPPPVTLSVSVPPSVILGSTVEVVGYVKNNLASQVEGHVTLRSKEGGSTEVMEKFVKVKPNAYTIVKVNVTAQIIGDIFVALSSNISSRLTATRKVSVLPLS